MKTVYLVRHAETTWNLEGRVQGSRDTPLSVDGLAQTAKTVAYLSTLRFDTIFTSPLPRARAIAEPVGINIGIPPIVMPELREIEFGGWEGHSWNEIGVMFPTTMAASLWMTCVAAPKRCVRSSKTVPLTRRSSSLTEGSTAS
jgi:broad specificity phosphatase PhoE